MHSNNTIFDIETGPLAWDEMAMFYEAPPALGPFNPDGVKCKGYSDERKAKKIADERAAHEAALANEAIERELHRQEFIARAALDWRTGQILAIGLRQPSRYAIYGRSGESEADILIGFWNFFQDCTKNQGKLIGFNCRKFDVPFLINRSRLHDVPVPAEAIEHYRYPSAAFVDLMELVMLGSGKFISLDECAQFLKEGGKPEGVDGGMFATLWNAPETREQAIQYLKNDLEMTWNIAKRMGLVI